MAEDAGQHEGYEQEEWSASQARIDRLEVENFKSYKGHQYIGPFQGFTAIIGPNGSGKSNLMDAISFVLGVKTSQLRGSLKELLYSNGDPAQKDRPRRGYVKLVLRQPDGAEVTFARHIHPSSASDEDAAYASVYKVNERAVSWEAYGQRLGSYGILVKVRNFLVFQVRSNPSFPFVPTLHAHLVLCPPLHGRRSSAAARETREQLPVPSPAPAYLLTMHLPSLAHTHPPAAGRH